jgi:hypothetical protein
MTSPKHHPHPHHQPKPAAQPAPAPEPKDLPPIKSWAYPFATNSGKSPPDAQDYLQALGVAGDGFYPLGASGIWHGGIHFDQQTDGMLKQGDGVRAIADGEVVAYRLDSKYVELNYSDGRKARYSTGFVLVHHKLALPPLPDPSKTNSNDAAKPPPSDEVLDFYSLYMHQSDWASYQEAEKSTSPPADSAKLPTPAVQRMPFWQGNAYYRVGSKANDKQNPATGSSNPVAPDAAPAANAPLVVGLHIHDKAKGKILGLLPQGTELTVSATSTPGWVTIASISKGAPVGDMQGADPQPGASNGWVFLDDLDSLIDPSPLDAVVVLTKPFRVKAGDLLGYVGQYVRHGDASVLPAASTSRPLLHLEVFAGDAFPAFLDKSRERAKKLPDGQNTLLVVSPGAALVDVSQPVDQKVAIGLTLEPVAGKSGNGPWTKVQPTKIATTHAPHGTHHPTTSRTKEGDPFWVEHAQSGQVVAGVVNGWKDFPLQPSNPKLATASFMDVFASAELSRLGADARSVDDQDVHWWKIEVGTGTGKSGSGWVCGKGHPLAEWQSPWAWPGFEAVDGTAVPMADMFKRFILVSGQALPDEETSFQASAVTVNGSELFTKLEKAIDLDGNGTVTAQELATAHSTSWLAEALSHLVVRYETEWGGDPSKWPALTPIMKERAPIWVDEYQRIQKLQWWDQVKAVKDFPSSPTVYHFHPIGLIGNFMCNCNCINVDAFLQAYETQHVSFETGTQPLDATSKENLRIFIQGILDYYKKYEDGKCDIPYIAYMLGTARLETKKYHKDLKTFIYFEPTSEGGALDYFDKYDPVLADTEKHRQRAKDSGNTAQGDGYKYRGRGYVQVTWKNAYRAVGDKIGVDLVNNPDRMQEPAIAAWATVYGMETGLFTGKKLSDYVSDTQQDYFNARQIINGHDQADVIAGFATRFKTILESTKC